MERRRNICLGKRNFDLSEVLRYAMEFIDWDAVAHNFEEDASFMDDARAD